MSSETRTVAPTHLRGDPFGNAVWEEAGAIYTWTDKQAIISLASLPNALGGTRPSRYGNHFAYQFFDPVAQNWQVRGYDMGNSNYGQTFHVQSVEPQPDIFDRSIVHLGSQQSLELRFTDFPHDHKADWQFGGLCASIHNPRAGGLSGEFHPRFALFHGIGCGVDGNSVLYIVLNRPGISGGSCT